MKKRALFAGLGNMGFPMALNLLKKGITLHGFDLSDKKKEGFQAAGGIWAEDLETSAREADILISMLPGGEEIQALYLKKQKLLSFLKPGALAIDCATCDPKACRKVHQAAKKKSILMIFAPVSGGVAGAKAGTLTFMAGGPRRDFKAAEPVLRLMGRKIWHAGPGAGDGQAAKICNNLLLAIHMTGTCEALALGKAMGIPPKTLSEIMKSSSGANWSLEHYHPCPGLMKNAPSSNNYEGGFSIRLMMKDLNLALRAMLDTSQRTDLGLKVFEAYKSHVAIRNLFDKDFSLDKDFSHIWTRYADNE